MTTVFPLHGRCVSALTAVGVKAVHTGQGCTHLKLTIDGSHINNRRRTLRLLFFFVIQNHIVITLHKVFACLIERLKRHTTIRIQLLTKIQVKTPIKVYTDLPPGFATLNFFMLCCKPQQRDGLPFHTNPVTFRILREFTIAKAIDAITFPLKGRLQELSATRSLN